MGHGRLSQLVEINVFGHLGNLRITRARNLFGDQ